MPRREPERTCIVERTVKPAAQMIRFVLGPDGGVVPDLKRHLPGRGVWVTAQADSVRQAVRRKLFARGFKAPVTAPDSLADDIESTLLRELRQALALANKAGAVVTGFAKVEAAIVKGGLSALVQASDGSADGLRKLLQALRKQAEGAICTFPVIDDLPSRELDLALGRSNVIHAALVAGSGSDGCLASWNRLRSYRGVSAGIDHPPHEIERSRDSEQSGVGPAGSDRNE